MFQHVRTLWPTDMTMTSDEYQFLSVVRNLMMSPAKSDRTSRARKHIGQMSARPVLN